MRLPTAVLLAALLTGCSAAGDRGGPLSATLVSPTDITLTWDPAAWPHAAGQAVEFATEPGGQYTVLQFAPPGQTTFAHPDLIPQTPFYYRIRPYFGPASQPVEVVLPAEEFTERDQRNDHEWAVPRTVPGAAATHSVRDGEAAGPGELKAEVMHANGIRFTWADRTRDEQGYLLEVKVEGRAEWSTAAVLDPDVNSYGLITLPGEKRAAYRVRAFYYGESSNVAHQTTGRKP